MTTRILCPLCGGVCSGYASDKRRSYYQCAVCTLVIAAPESRLNREAERAEYEKHENVANDPGYRRFVARLFTPIAQQLAAPAKVLDFGSGQSSALAALFTEAGYSVSQFDPFFQPDLRVLNAHYDIIVLSEVLEHLYEPEKELRRLWSMLKSGGLLGLQTQRLISAERFSNWRYKDDPTHVAFYSDAALQHLAALLGARLELQLRDVALLHKL